MIRIYYVYDTHDKVRLHIAFDSVIRASAMCERLNKESPGRYQSGDWVSFEEWRKLWNG